MNWLRTNLLALSLFAVFRAAGAEEPFRWERDGREVRCYGAPGCYLYEEATSVAAHRADGRKIAFRPPEATGYTDEVMGQVRIYPAQDGKPWVWQADGDLPDVVTVNFQGCRQAVPGIPALCYPPETLTLTAVGTLKNATKDPVTLPSDLAAALGKFQTAGARSGLFGAEEIASWIRSCRSDGKVTGVSVTFQQAPGKGFWAMFLLVVLGGLGLNLTPCVLPMIPINLALIGAGTNAGKWQGFRRGSAYALGIAVTYGALGIPAALSGAQFGTINSSSIFNFIIAALFAVLAAGMFGAYNLDFSHFGAKLGGPRQSSGHLADWSAFGMGAVAALLAGACVAPVVLSVMLLAAEIYAAGNVWGALLPLALGTSMALPWPLAGMGLAVLPKPGAWMNKVKFGFGLFIAGMAVYYAILGVRLLPGNFDQLRELDRLAAELNEAAAKHETVLLDFSASWCKNCAALKRTMSGDTVKRALQGVCVIEFRAERLADPGVRALLDRWQLPGLPALVMLVPETEETR